MKIPAPIDTPTRSGKAAAAPWRRSALLATLGLGLGCFIPTAQAEVLVYEGFDYAAPAVGGQTTSANLTSLNGQTLSLATGNNPTGLTGAWVAGHTNTSPYPNPSGFAICNNTMQTIWNGSSTSLIQTGKFAGSPAPVMAAGSLNGNSPDHLWAYRSIDPSVTAKFTLGATTWMSFEQASNFKANANGLGISFAIGAGDLGDATGEDRGQVSKGGGAVGIGFGLDHFFKAAAWGNGTAAGSLTGTSVTTGVDPTAAANGGTGPVSYGGVWPSTNITSPYVQNNATTPKICVAKIIWGDTSNPTTIKVAVFNEGVALSTLNEQGFDNVAVSYMTAANLDPSTYNRISLGGARCNVDELRLGTTLNDVLGIVISSTGNYWAPEAGGGGTGTWSSSSKVWATAPSVQGTGGQAATGALIFSGAAGTVTLDGTVSVAAGLQFLTTGYIVVAGASTPSLSLTGANAAANSISVDSGKTTTISAAITGTTGLTKDGAGILILENTANGYGGGTMLNAGTLRITDLGNLGTGTVTFGGGILQYPAGSGTSTLDLSGKINAVPTGQTAKIDTNGNDVTFGTPMGGDGGLTKLGAGSLTLAANISPLADAVTASAGTLNIGSASGTIGTLNVPTGGTVNLGAGAVVTNLNITGGTVHITGAGVTVATLEAPIGTLEAATHSLAVTTQATVAGIRLAGTAVTLSGANVIAPDAVNHRLVAVSGGVLGFVATGLDVAIGIAVPGSNAAPATTTFSGSGVWALNGGVVATPGNVYGKDNHAFHYIQIPSGNFEIMAHVTGHTNARAGLLVRNNLASTPAPNPLPPNPLPRAATGTGNWMAVWNGMASSTMNGVDPTVQNIAATGNTPYLKITKVGEVITTYYSTNGSDYTQAQQRDYSLSATGWGSPTYVGLDLTDTGATAVSGAFDNVNFMGTASMPELRTTDFALTGGAQLNLDFTGTMRLGALSIDGAPQPDGSYGSSAVSPAPDHVDDIHFAGAGTVTLGRVTPVIAWNNPAPITVGTALSGKQLNASSVPGIMTYTPPLEEVLPLGSHKLRVDFVPTDTDSYNSAFKEVTVEVIKEMPVIEWDTPAPIPTGTPLGDTQLNAYCWVEGTLTYTPPIGTVLADGSHTLRVDFVPNDPLNFSNASKQVTLLVGTYLVWINSPDYNFPTALTAAQKLSTADPDRDGMTNQQEFAFGLNPVSGASVNPITVPFDKSSGTFSYTRRFGTGLHYSVWTSTDLANWTEDSGATEGTITTEVDVETVPIRLSAPPFSEKLFVRVKAE
jgi:autotransporter-associated beta strand protein